MAAPCNVNMQQPNDAATPFHIATLQGHAVIAQRMPGHTSVCQDILSTVSPRDASVIAQQLLAAQSDLHLWVLNLLALLVQQQKY
jgi:hypothetical protein